MPKNFDPEFASELHSSNRILHMDARIREVINYMEMYVQDESVPSEVLKIAIDKLDKI